MKQLSEERPVCCRYIAGSTMCYLFGSGLFFQCVNRGAEPQTSDEDAKPSNISKVN